MIGKTPLQQRVDTITASCVDATSRAEVIVRHFDQQRKLAQELRDALNATIGTWLRPCWICEAPAKCRHREPELIERWETGATR